MAEAPTPVVLSDGGKVAVKGNTQFAVELYARLAAEARGNVFFSPYSISAALAMTDAGAAGRTDQQMRDVLRLALPDDQLSTAMKSLAAVLDRSGRDNGCQLRIANRLWGRKEFHFLPEFLSVTSRDYGAELAQLDFSGHAEQSRRNINQWVEKQTDDKIRDLLPPGMINRDTRLILTNAVYFKGAWVNKFQEQGTEDEPFHLSASEQINTPTMHQVSRFRYGAGENCKILELPYGQRGAQSMFVLLPDKVDGLPELEKNLSGENLAKWFGGMKAERVVVSLPRFKMTSEFGLREALVALGMELPFDPDHADFSRMSSEERLYISAAIHKAYVDVNENGTEAAAATAVAIALAAAMPAAEQPIEFHADHPFLFLIRDNETGTILFLGRLTQPEPGKGAAAAKTEDPR